MDSNQEFSLYKDMKARTNGEIYIGVVGPVRTGKLKDLWTCAYCRRWKMNMYVRGQRTNCRRAPREQQL